MKVEPVRVGVIGTGIMGGHHTRVASTIPSSQLIGIFDPDLARAEEVARQFDTQSFSSIDALCDTVEAVIIASPTRTHAAIAEKCLQAGCHVLVEKPIASTVAEGQALIDTATRTNRQLMVGHLERFNPAVTVAMTLLSQETIFDATFQRLSPTPPRDRSADIIFDLMIHDLDLAMAFIDSEVVSVAAVGNRVRCEFIDHVTALLRYANGATVTLSASAVSQERVRKGILFTHNAQFTIDFASREVSIHRQGHSSIAKEDGQYYQASQVEQILVPNREPLAVEQEHFYMAIRTGSQPLITAHDGLEALQLAQSIQDCVNQQLGQPV